MKSEVIGLLRPFRGPDVRRMCAFFTLAVAIPRLPLWETAPMFSPLTILPPAAFGWITLVLGVALLATNGPRRHLFYGRLVAFVGLVVFGILTGATTSVTSMIINVGVMWAMVGEIGANKYDV
jgi:hypothetical protein